MASAIQARRPAERLASDALRLQVRRRVGEFSAVALALAGLSVLVALAWYDPRDPSLNTATARAAQNLAGRPGALIADLLLQGFGLMGLLPGATLLAWAWRLGSHRGLANLPLRLAALLAAMPVGAAVLAAIPGPHGAAIEWPTAAGLGGAAGAVAKGDALEAGAQVLGPVGPPLVWALGAILAILLVVLALGLTAGEWRTAGAGLGRIAWGVRVVVGAAAGLTGRAGMAGLRLLARVNGTRPFRGPAADQPEATEDDAPVIPQPRPRPPAAPAAMPPAPPPPDIARPRVLQPAKKPPMAPPRQESLALEGGWRFPSLDLLKSPPARASLGAPSETALQANARLLESVLADYGVQGQIVEIRPGPVVTLYELEPAPGIRSARVIGLADDVARSLSVTAVRIATVSGRNVIGIEVPNAKRETVFLSELLAHRRLAEASRPPRPRPRQGHRRRPDHRRPRPHAAPARRRHHRLGQIGRHQRHDPVDPLPHVARPVPPDPDRPENAGAVRL